MMQVVAPVAGDRLRHLGEQRLDIAQQQVSQRRPQRRRHAQGARAYAQGRAADLHHRLAGIGAGAQRRQGAHNALAADQSGLDEAAVLQALHQGHEAVLREIDVLDQHVRVQQNLPGRQGDQLQVGPQREEVVLRQGGQDPIADSEQRWRDHLDLLAFRRTGGARNGLHVRGCALPYTRRPAGRAEFRLGIADRAGPAAGPAVTRVWGSRR